MKTYELKHHAQQFIGLLDDLQDAKKALHSTKNSPYYDTEAIKNGEVKACEKLVESAQSKIESKLRIITLKVQEAKS